MKAAMKGKTMKAMKVFATSPLKKWCDSVKEFEALVAAKKKEIATLSSSLDTKMQRVGELGVEIAEMKNDIGDTAENLEADKKVQPISRRIVARRRDPREGEGHARRRSGCCGGHDHDSER